MVICHKTKGDFPMFSINNLKGPPYFFPSKKFFQKSKNNACIFRQSVLLYRSCRETAKQNPGVAKFGIALEWGSRGLEFESRHSDQKCRNDSMSFLHFSFMFEIQTIKCNNYNYPSFLYVRRSVCIPKQFRHKYRYVHILRYTVF